MFLVVKETIVVESPLDLIRVFANINFLMCMFILVTALLLMYSGKYSKLRPIALILTAIVFIMSFIVFGSPF